MSLYEIVSMIKALEKRGKKHAPEVSDEEWAQAEDMLRSVTRNDPKVVLH